MLVRFTSFNWSGELMGRMMASFMTFPEHGIVGHVDISYADTYSFAVKIARAFEEQMRTKV